MTGNLGRICLVGTLLGLSGGQFAILSSALAQSQHHSGATHMTPIESTTQEYNERLEELAEYSASPGELSGDYRIGADDLLEISVYGAPDLGGTVRVSADGSISLPLIGDERAEGLTALDLERQTAGLLAKEYMNHPQVNVFVKEIQSHTVSVIGAVGKPGVFQIRGPESLVEVLSMAQGLADDAGDRVILMRHGEIADAISPRSPHPQPSRVNAAISRGESAKPESLANDSRNSGLDEAEGLQINLKDLLMSRDPSYDVMVYPGDVVKVPPAGIVYVVGQVRKPGGFLLKTNQNLSVLQALALAEGTTSTSAEKRARIIRTEELNGKREEIPIDLKRILAGKAADPVLQARDILFVPNSAGKTAFYRGAEAAVSITGGLIVYRSW